MTDESTDSPDTDPFAAQNTRAEKLIEQGDYPLATDDSEFLFRDIYNRVYRVRRPDTGYTHAAKG